MTVALREPIAAISNCLDDVRATFNVLDDKGLTQALREIETLSRRTHAVMLDLLAELDSRGTATREGFGSTARLLGGILRLSASEARARVEHAVMVGTRHTITGDTLPPRLPATAAALAAGEIGTGQLRVITETIAALPASVPEPARERAEADLAGYARDFDPRRLRIIAHRLLTTLDPDGPPPSDDPTPTAPVRGELWLRDRRDGRLGLEGWLDPGHGSIVRSLIEQRAGRRPTAEGVPDTRTVPQRQADALIELCDRARATDEFPTSGGEPPHVTVTIDWDALRTGLGAATLDYGQLISAGDARRLSCECKLIPVVLGSDWRTTRRRSRHAHRPPGHSSRPGGPRRWVQLPGLSSATRNLCGASRAALGRRRRNHSGELLPLVPDAPPTSAPARLGHHYSRRTRRIPTTRDHRPGSSAPHQPTPTLITTGQDP